MAKDFGKLASGRVLYEEALPSDFTDLTRGTILLTAASDSAFETAVGRSAADKDFYFNTTQNIFKQHDGTRWRALYSSAPTGLSNSRLFRRSQEVVAIEPRDFRRKKLFVQGEEVDITGKSLDLTTDNLLASDGTDSGSPPGSSGLLYVYLSNGSASYKPYSLRASSTAHTSGYLAGSGNGNNWRFVGVCYFNNATSGVDEAFHVCGYGVDTFVIPIAEVNRSSGGAGYYQVQQTDYTVLDSTIAIHQGTFIASHTGTNTYDHDLYQNYLATVLGSSYVGSDLNQYGDTIFGVYQYSAEARQGFALRYYYPGSGSYQMTSESYLVLTRITGGPVAAIKDYSLLPEYAEKWHADSTVLSGNAIQGASTGSQVLGYYYYQNPAALNDEFSCGELALNSGQYNFNVIGVRLSTAGIIEWKLYPESGATAITITSGQDWYGGTQYDHKKTETVVIPSPGSYELRGKVVSKNASSGGYNMALTDIYFEKNI